MAYPGTPTIPRGEEHFFNLVYTGTSTGQTIGRFLPFTNNGTISKSLIFEDGDSAYLSRTHSASNKKHLHLVLGLKEGILDPIKEYSMHQMLVIMNILFLEILMYFIFIQVMQQLMLKQQELLKMFQNGTI